MFDTSPGTSDHAVCCKTTWRARRRRRGENFTVSPYGDFARVRLAAAPKTTTTPDLHLNRDVRIDFPPRTFRRNRLATFMRPDDSSV